MSTIAALCAGCGARLSITPDLDQITCVYCGVTQVVRRNQGVIGLKRVEGAISRVQSGTDRTALELAIRRIKDDLGDARKKKADFDKTLEDFGQGVISKLIGAIVVGLTALLLLICSIWTYAIFSLLITGFLVWYWHQSNQSHTTMIRYSTRVLNKKVSDLEADLEREHSILTKIQAEQDVHSNTH
jgi:DNA-directed RNA polymerase subunit RPC12/RpoP